MTSKLHALFGDLIDVARRADAGEEVPPGYVYRADVGAVSAPDGRMVILHDDRRPEAPVYVDVHITDVCRAGCPYCYRSSMPGGEHAEIATIRAFLDSFGEYPPLLVTLGGGEPTEHPQFVEIVREIGERGIVVTASVGRAANTHVLQKAVPYLKRVGVSVSPGPIEPILRLVSICAGKAVLHVPLFPSVVENAVKILNTLIISGRRDVVSILALTPQNVGRGKQYQTVTHAQIASAIKLLASYAVFMRVEFAGNPCWTNNNAALPEEINMHCAGGQWGMAFDAVRCTMNRCSYLFEESEPGIDVRAWWQKQTLKTHCPYELPPIPALHNEYGEPLIPTYIHNLPLPPELLVTSLFSRPFPARIR